MKPLLDQELALFDAVAKEQAEVFGVTANLWSMAQDQRDPLFDEPADDFQFTGPFFLSGVFFRWMDFEQISDEAREEGGRREGMTEVTIPRILIEDGGFPAPKEGDVIQLWVTDSSAIPGREQPSLYLDLKKVGEHGPILNSRSFLSYRCEGEVRSEFSPQARLQEQGL